MAISKGGLDLQTAKGYGISLETATDYNDMGLAGIYDKRSEKVLCLLLCPLVFLNRWFKYWCNLLNSQFVIVIMIIMTVNAGFILLPSKLNKILFFWPLK